MADSWVRVVQSDGGGAGAEIFVDENYGDAAGAIGTAFVTDTGQHTFQTIDAAGQPAWQTTQIIDRPPDNSEEQPVTVVLAPA
jgi:photosystem II stability/assembly factor-like uncharacterized protein